VNESECGSELRSRSCLVEASPPASRHGITRRAVLGAVAGAALASGAPRRAFTQYAGTSLERTELGDGLHWIAGAGANVLVTETPNALLLVDGGLPDRSARLRALVAERWPDRRVDVLFNTNWREEHTGSNEALGAAGTRIMAHENTKLWLGGDFFVEWESRRYRPRPAAALPVATFYASGSLDLGGRRVDYLHLPRAHTDGDVAVFLPDANVLAASDLVAVGSYPVLDYVTGGWIGGLEAATKSLLATVDSSTRILPAMGPICSCAELEAQLELCTAVRERVAEGLSRGMSFAEFVESKPTREFDAARGRPDAFLTQVYEGAWYHVRELGGII